MFAEESGHVLPGPAPSGQVGLQARGGGLRGNPSPRWTPAQASLSLLLLPELDWVRLEEGLLVSLHMAVLEVWSWGGSIT